jgi:hypothetical protein
LSEGRSWGFRRLFENHCKLHTELAAKGLHRAILPDGFRQGTGPVNNSRHRATSGRHRVTRQARYRGGASLAIQAPIEWGFWIATELKTLGHLRDDIYSWMEQRHDTATK